jgi:hypothetical protein
MSLPSFQVFHLSAIDAWPWVRGSNFYATRFILNHPASHPPTMPGFWSFEKEGAPLPV